MERRLKEILTAAEKNIFNIADNTSLNNYWLELFGSNGIITKIFKDFKALPSSQKPEIGKMANEIKNKVNSFFNLRKIEINKLKLKQVLDVTMPGFRPPQGHLHLVSYAISEITSIFENIGFTRVRYPEVEWEWYAFESLNMPKNHPARDDIETFFIDTPSSKKYGRMVLSPHTSSGQVREMERVKSIAPIRMINIAKCYRPNWDISHTPMFHQFEGLVVDSGINITHLKGTMDYFARKFFGPQRKTRLRPFHFRFTEPSFEVDINCGLCLGKGVLDNGEKCRLCKSGWLELGGSGMVHPKVLLNGHIDPQKYTGFAFGWGVERTYLMKEGMKISDLRILYQNDIRFLEQF